MEPNLQVINAYHFIYYYNSTSIPSNNNLFSKQAEAIGTLHTTNYKQSCGFKLHEGLIIYGVNPAP